MRNNGFIYFSDAGGDFNVIWIMINPPPLSWERRIRGGEADLIWEVAFGEPQLR
jgi:hypothetical protein